ncbi:MAG: SHOCT domain-containing protein [Solirubrobacterales bacterium]|nr:SHOCT domain-containing protein [Solirubrobacterales bacterium]
MGLLKTGMKAAIAVRTADVIHERIQRRQVEHARVYGHAGAAGPTSMVGVPASAPAASVSAPAAAAAASPPAHDTSNMLAQLAQLGELRTAGVLTDAEFEVQKAQILAG